MKEYKVEIRRHIYRNITVEAESPQKALELAQDILDDNDMFEKPEDWSDYVDKALRIVKDKPPRKKKD